MCSIEIVMFIFWEEGVHEFSNVTYSVLLPTYNGGKKKIFKAIALLLVAEQNQILDGRER